jgi:hypothetical protein
MRDELILRSVIRKVVKTGWAEFFDAEEERRFYAGDMVTVRGIIFSPAFAKAFWGDEDWTRVSYSLFPDAPKSGRDVMIEPKTLKAWQYHLQQMALEENLLEYLAQFLDIN